MQILLLSFIFPGKYHSSSMFGSQDLISLQAIDLDVQKKEELS
jgi:hypothetical protein